MKWKKLKSIIGKFFRTITIDECSCSRQYWPAEKILQFWYNISCSQENKGIIYNNNLGDTINIALSFVLVPLIEINGAAISGAVGFFIVSILRLKQTSEWIKIQIEWKLQGILILGYATLTVIAYINFSLIIIKIAIIMIMVILLFRYIKKIQSRKDL